MYFTYALCIAVLGVPAPPTDSPTPKTIATPRAISTLVRPELAASRNQFLTRPNAIERNVATPATPAILTIEQEEAAWRHALDITFNIDHSP